MYKILIADDESIVTDGLRFIIDKNFQDECTVECVNTGRKVIEMAEYFRPDIVFMDIQMPGINGIEAMREIRQGNDNTIFIVVSAFLKFDYAKDAIDIGVLEYLNKPVDKEQIVRVLKKAMMKGWLVVALLNQSKKPVAGIKNGVRTAITLIIRMKSCFFISVGSRIRQQLSR